MTEIPMADDTGAPPGERPREVSIASYIILLDAIAGIITGGIGFVIWEDAASGAGIILGLIAIWLYFQILKQDRMSWTLAVIFNIAGILLYAYGENWAGVVLSAISVIYLNLPDVSKHFR
ncbi:MAG: hypothetical protein ACXADO_07110 [Candidatus Thorarchaeota archaeon]|jgi:Trk-type K+ transport system membrane component